MSRPLVKVALALAVCIAAGVAFADLVDCGGSKITPEDSTALTSETMQDTACVVENRGDAGAMNACREANRKAFNAYWAEYFDGGAQ